MKEISAMFDNKIWSTVPMKEMDDYYDSLTREGVDFQRKRLNLIWSFKRKKNADGSLRKHKARLC